MLDLDQSKRGHDHGRYSLRCTFCGAGRKWASGPACRRSRLEQRRLSRHSLLSANGGVLLGAGGSGESGARAFIAFSQR